MAMELAETVGKKYVIHVKTDAGDSTYETDTIEDTLSSLIRELKRTGSHLLDIKVDRGTLEQHFIELARREKK